MKKTSHGKQWILAAGLALFSFACQSNTPPSADNSNPARQREWQNREQERMDRKMEERKMIEQGGGQSQSYKGYPDEDQSKCGPCNAFKKCPAQGDNASTEAPQEATAPEATSVVAEPVLEKAAETLQTTADSPADSQQADESCADTAQK